MCDVLSTNLWHKVLMKVLIGMMMLVIKVSGAAAHGDNDDRNGEHQCWW